MTTTEQLRAEIPDRITFDLKEFKVWLKCYIDLDMDKLRLDIDYEIYHG